jgi:AraC-like DNA-binding protein
MENPAMIVRRVRPSAELAPFIEHFGLREARLGHAQIYTPLPARSDCFLEIYLADRYRIVDVASGAVHRAPRLVLVGPHTRRREDLLLSGTLKVFHIHFKPMGFRHLFGLPAHAVADSAESADAVLGLEVSDLADRLAVGAALPELVNVAESFLRSKLRSVVPLPAATALAALARRLDRSHGGLEIAPLAARYQLGIRQVERLFQEYVGVTPKVFSRLARFRLALDLSLRDPQPDWASIAPAAGYYDQSHMARDFRSFTGETPARFTALRRRAALPTVEAENPDHVAFVLSRGVDQGLMSDS